MFHFGVLNYILSQESRKSFHFFFRVILVDLDTDIDTDNII